MSWFIGIWGAAVTALFVASFLSDKAASFEPFGRFMYMAVLAISIIAVALRLMRSRQSEEKQWRNPRLRS